MLHDLHFTLDNYDYIKTGDCRCLQNIIRDNMPILRD